MNAIQALSQLSYTPRYGKVRLLTFAFSVRRCCYTLVPRSQLSYTARYIDKFILTTKYIIRNMLHSVKKKIKNAVKILSQCVAQRQIIVPHIIVAFGQKSDCLKAICEKFFLSFVGKSITME